VQSGSGMSARKQGQSGKIVTVTDIVAAVGMPCDIIGRSDRSVSRPAPITDAASDCVSFYSKSAEQSARVIGESGAAVVLCTAEAAAAVGESKTGTLLLVSNPRLAFIRVMNAFFAPERPVGIHPTAVIHPEAELGERVYIGPFCYVGKVSIGDDTVLDGHVYLYDNVRVGRHVHIKSGAVIGGDGFGYERCPDGYPEDFPDIGGVIVEDYVSIGSSACIDRGALGDTRLGIGSRVDNLVHVAHNVHMAEHCMLVAGCVIGGSATLGARSYIGPNAWVTNGLALGADSFVTAGAVVTRDVPAGARVTGNFAIDHARFIEWMRSRG